MGTVPSMPDPTAADLTEQVRVLRALRSHVRDDERALAASRTAGLISARAAFAEHTRIGLLRADDHRLTQMIRRQAIEADAALASRAEQLLVLVDEVLALEHEAVTGDDPSMRRAMARQAEAEMLAEAEALSQAIETARATRRARAMRRGQAAQAAPEATHGHDRASLRLIRTS